VRRSQKLTRTAFAEKGEEVELFVIRLGNAQIEGKLQPVLVDKFVKP